MTHIEAAAAATDPPGPRRRRRALGILTALALPVVVVGLLVFQPWKLLVDDVVDESFPVAAARATATSGSSAPDPDPGTTAATSPPVVGEPVVEARGSFISHEHGTTGEVLLLRLPGGSRVLRLEGLDTSNGPDLKVWLSDAAVVDGPSGWRTFDDGRYLDLGSLKGNVGNQNYAIPADADLAGLTSLSIWCDRFDVSFGAAELRPA
jgi:Electron transfer DM13